MTPSDGTVPELPGLGPPPDGSDLPAGPPEHSGPDHGAGGQPAGPASGVPVATPLWRRRRVQTLAGIVALLLVALGVGVQRTVTGHAGSHAPPGSLILPRRLLGLGENISKTRDLDRSMPAHSAARGLADGVYGHLPEGFLVIGGRVCRGCIFKSFTAAMVGLHVSGVATHTFAPGPKGGSLLCADHSAVRVSPGAFACWWFDNTSGAVIFYGPKVASSLANAAELTRQLRAAVEQ